MRIKDDKHILWYVGGNVWGYTKTEFRPYGMVVLSF